MSTAPLDRASVTKSRSQSIPAVKLWASVGAFLLATELFFVAKWVLGPNFVKVPSGPDSPPGWMKTAMITGEFIFVAGALWFIYRFLWKPWHQERRISTDGMLVIIAILASPFDMLSNYSHYWFTYSSYLVNRGSVLSEIPGAVQPHTAGVGEAWPILLVGGAYVVIFVGLAIIGCAFLRRVKARWPALGAVRLVLVLYVATMLLYFVFDGIIAMPLGFWAFQGGHWPINGSHYYKYPLQEMVTAGAVFTSFTCVRYFVNDRGETLGERGLDRVNATPARKTLLRLLGMLAIVHIGIFFSYHLPNALMARSATPWPRDIQTRSYLTNQICGPNIARPCPGSSEPVSKHAR